MQQYQIHVEYLNGAVFVFGLTATGPGAALLKSDEIRPPGKANTKVTPVKPADDRE